MQVFALIFTRRKEVFVMQIGIIDIGSNTIKISVFSDAEKRPTEIYSKTVHAKLSSHIENGDLSEKGIRILSRSLCLLKRSARTMGCKKENIFAFATACIRNAQNRDIILRRAKRASKLKISLLDGKEEAELCFAGATASSGCPCEGILADLGGGSCEFVHFSDGNIISSVSLNVGALVMHKRFSSKKYITAPESRELSEFLCNLFSEELAPFSKSPSLPMVVTGGSARAAVKLISALDKVDPALPFEITAKKIDFLTESFFNGELSQVYESVLKERAQTLLPALFVFKEASKSIGTYRFTVIDGGARLGLASRILSKKGKAL